VRLSRLFTKTLKETPSEADTISHQLLLRAGMIYQIASGIYSFLPLGWRVLRKIEAIIREEMDKVGGQELMLSMLQPIELWEESGRLPSFGKTLFTIVDRREHRLALGPTHEEVITVLVRRYVKSYRDLPLLLYQIQNKFRDEPRPRGGLLRVREFIMKDLYSFDASEEALDETYKKMIQAYKNIYARCGLPAVLVEADSGAIGGKESHEFTLITESGEDEIIHCPSCGYAANKEKARSVKPSLDIAPLLPLEEISTPNAKTIEQVANFVGVPTSQTLKAVFYWVDGQIIFVVVRGDFEVNETKLKNLLKCTDIRLASEEEVKQAGLVAGAASPVGIKGIKVVADDSIILGSNFIAGGNRPDTHFKNVNYPRDFKVDVMSDIVSARPGDNCPKCNGKLLLSHGIEIGHVFKLGTFLSEKLGAYFLDKNGASRPVIMGCYGIGLGRLLAATVELSHDEKGIIWPIAIAPFQVYLCPLNMEDKDISETAEKLYCQLVNEGIEVLFDDRVESAGVKFNDADLLGIPLRVTLSRRTLESQSVEVKWRKQKQPQLIPIEGLARQLESLLESYRKEELAIQNRDISTM
jgi:prolyl-tRNA synthetase